MHGRFRTLAVAAFVFAAAGGLAREGRAQIVTDSTADSVPRLRGLRNPTTAVVLGAVIPGAGLMYAGHWVHGIVTYEGSILAIGGGALISLGDRCEFSFLSSTTCKSGPTWPQHVVGAGLVAVGIGVWTYGAIAAKRTVERDNAEKRAAAPPRLGSIAPSVAVPLAPGEPWRFGVHATW